MASYHRNSYPGGAHTQREEDKLYEFPVHSSLALDDFVILSSGAVTILGRGPRAAVVGLGNRV